MTPDEIREAATLFAREHRQKIANEVTNKDRFKPETQPVSTFMAGSPGAGKTEFSKELLSILQDGEQQPVLRIDGDELRARIPGYTGSNSELFQTAVSLIVERIHDHALDRRQSFILDGTFSKYEKASDNIQRSLNKGRSVFIFYVYQTPTTAWRFTQAREQTEGRNIPKGAFIEQFCGAKETIDRIHREFTDKVLIYLVMKDFITSKTKEIVELVDANTSIDSYIGEQYTREELETLL